MSDSGYPDVGQTIHPDGTVTYDFRGHVHADGLDLDAPTAQTSTDNMVRWIRTADGAAVAYIAGVDNGTTQLAIVAQPVAPSTDAFLQFTASGPKAATVIVRNDGTARVVAAADVHDRTVVDDTGASDFVQIVGATDLLKLAKGHQSYSAIGGWETTYVAFDDALAVTAFAFFAISTPVGASIAGSHMQGFDAGGVNVAFDSTIAQDIDIYVLGLGT